MQITDIYKVAYMKDSFAYIGKLRNQNKFNIGADVFFAPNKHKGVIVRGVIIGVELRPAENPEYIYKIRIPDAYDNNYSKDTYDNIICDAIFSSIDEAKESAKDNCAQMYKLQMQEIERYFARFTKITTP
jgi:hypothetical protein